MNPIGRMFMATHVALFRATGGKVGGSMGTGKILLLTTTGNKTGKQRTVPVMSFEHEGQRFVIASAAGAPTHPAWFANLRANPVVTVEVGAEVFTARAIVAERAERDRLYAAHARVHPSFDDYQERTTRVIPVVLLERLG